MNRSCPICCCLKKTFLYKQNFNNKAISLMENYDVVVCQDCGFAYADNIPPQADFSKYYATMSKYEFNYKNGFVSKDYVNHYTQIVSFLIPHLSDKSTRILDVGCSTGGLLSLLKLKEYHNLFGIDPSLECARIAKELYGIEATAKTLSDFDSSEKFDLIILSGVLEHLVDLNDSMQKIRTLLKDHSLLFIEVPDVERFYLHISAPFQQFSTEHINYFSQCSIRNLLSNFSFRVVDTQQDEHKLSQTTEFDIFNLSRKTNELALEIIRDNISEPSIRNYITQCSTNDLNIKQIIREKLSNKKKIIVWGVGTHTQRLIGSGLDLSKVLFFVDSNTRYHGKKINGIEIKSPDEIKVNVPILISTYSYQEEIAHQIRKVLKLNNEIIKIY